MMAILNIDSHGGVFVQQCLILFCEVPLFFFRSVKTAINKLFLLFPEANRS